MEYAVTVGIEAIDAPWEEDDAIALAKVGGAASFAPKWLDCTLTVEADDAVHAACLAEKEVNEILDSRGRICRLEVITTLEQDRRLVEDPFPKLVGISEIAKLLDVARQRASALQHRPDFPDPVQVLASGPVWREVDVEYFVHNWDRKPGRPSRTVPGDLGA